MVQFQKKLGEAVEAKGADHGAVEAVQELSLIHISEPTRPY